MVTGHNVVVDRVAGEPNATDGISEIDDFPTAVSVELNIQNGSINRCKVAVMLVCEIARCLSNYFFYVCVELVASLEAYTLLLARCFYVSMMFSWIQSITMNM
jgi:hypothetical protein